MRRMFDAVKILCFTIKLLLVRKRRLDEGEMQFGKFSSSYIS